MEDITKHVSVKSKKSSKTKKRECSSSDSSSDSNSDYSSSISSISVNSSDVLDNDLLNFVLKQFFMTKDGKNIATILEEINQALNKK